MKQFLQHIIRQIICKLEMTITISFVRYLLVNNYTPLRMKVQSCHHLLADCLLVTDKAGVCQDCKCAIF